MRSWNRVLSPLLPFLIVQAIPTGGCRKPGPPPAAVVSEDALAMVGDRPIRRAQLQERLDKLRPKVQREHFSAEKRLPMVEALIRRELLVQEARRRGLDDKDRPVDEQGLIDRLLERALGGDGGAGVSDAEIEQYYREHPAQFAGKEYLRISQVVAPSRAAAEAIARKARARPRSDFAWFAAVATRFSLHASSRARGGDLGFLGPDTLSLSGPLRASAFALREPGDISDVIQTDQGFHLLRLTERKPVVARPLAEVKNDIRQLILQERRMRLTEALIAESRTRSPVQIFESRLAATPTEQAAVPVSPGPHGM